MVFPMAVPPLLSPCPCQVGDLSAAHAAGVVAPGRSLRRDAGGHGHALYERRGGEDLMTSGAFLMGNGDIKTCPWKQCGRSDLTSLVWY